MTFWKPLVPREVAIFGAGPHGHEIADLSGRAMYMDGRRECMFDDDPLRGHPPVVGGETTWVGHYVAGAAMPITRRAIAAKAQGEAWNDGRVIFPGAQVSPRAAIGDHVHVLYNAVVSHGCRIGDFSTICAGAVLAGEVNVGEDVFIGANATVIHGGLTIGRGAVIGAGAVVVEDVSAGATVAGVPARELVR